jgi:hypothetical protein
MLVGATQSSMAFFGTGQRAHVTYLAMKVARLHVEQLAADLDPGFHAAPGSARHC